MMIPLWFLHSDLSVDLEGLGDEDPQNLFRKISSESNIQPGVQHPPYGCFPKIGKHPKMDGL